MKSTTLKTKPPSIEEAKALLAEYQEQRRRGEDLCGRIRATVRALGMVESNGGYGYAGSITLLKEALAEHAISKRWPPRRSK